MKNIKEIYIDYRRSKYDGKELEQFNAGIEKNGIDYYIECYTDEFYGFEDGYETAKREYEEMLKESCADIVQKVHHRINYDGIKNPTQACYGEHWNVIQVAKVIALIKEEYFKKWGSKKC